jgi:hypothetical protein
MTYSIWNAPSDTIDPSPIQAAEAQAAAGPQATGEDHDP